MTRGNNKAFDIAVVGTGGIAAIHARDAANLGGRARLVAAADTDPARLAEFGEQWSVPRLYPGLEALLDAERPDLVHLCTPPDLHAAQAIACLERGLTVLCEKPPTRTLAEFDAVAAAARHGGAFACVFQHRFGSGAQALRRAIESGRLGRPMTVVCHTLWYRPDNYFDVPWRGGWDNEGGGPTLGHGIHQIDLILSILGPWDEVVAVAARQARPTATEDLSCAIVTFANGVIATVVNSLLSPRQTSYVRFDLEHATVELEHLYGYSDRNWVVTAAPGREDEVAAAWAEGPTGLASGHARQLDIVLDALEAGTPPPVTPADARPTMELVAAVYASAFTGQRVRAGEIGPGSPFYDRMDGVGAPWATTVVTG